jgi:hypothetical protein
MKAQAGPSEGLVEAVALLDALIMASGLTSWIAGLEVGLQGADGATLGRPSNGTASAERRWTPPS